MKIRLIGRLLKYLNQAQIGTKLVVFPILSKDLDVYLKAIDSIEVKALANAKNLDIKFKVIDKC